MTAGKTKPRLNDLTLNERQKVFVEEYFKNGKKTVAAFKVAYPHMNFSNPQNLTNQAVKVRKHPAVAAAIRIGEGKEVAKLGAVMDRYAITQERIAEELAQIAFSSPKNLMEWDQDGVKVKPSSDLGEDVAATVAEVSETRNEKTGTIVKVKGYDKLAALTTLAKISGMLKEKHEHEHKHLSVQFVIEGRND